MGPRRFSEKSRKRSTACGNLLWRRDGDMNLDNYSHLRIMTVMILMRYLRLSKVWDWRLFGQSSASMQFDLKPLDVGRSVCNPGCQHARNTEYIRRQWLVLFFITYYTKCKLLIVAS